MKRSERGEIITAYILLSWFVLGLFGAAGHKIAKDLKAEKRQEHTYTDRYTVLRVNYNSGNTMGTCEERIDYQK